MIDKNITAIMSGKAIEKPERIAIGHYSFSSLNLLATCEEAWHSKYILKNKDSYSEKANFGLNFESKLAETMGATLSEEEKKAQKEQDEAYPDMDEEVTSGIRIYQNEANAWKDFDDYQVKTEIDPDMFAFFAKKLGIPKNIVLPLPYIGYIDFIRKGVIMDVKTSSRAGWNTNWAMQLMGYMLATENKEAEVHKFIRAKRNPRMNFYKFGLKDEWAKMLLIWIAEKTKRAKGIEDGSIIPVKKCSWLCNGYCTKKDCPGLAISTLEPE